MSLSAPKKYINRASNPKSQKTKKKNIKLQAYEFCKKLYQKYYANPNIYLLNQLKDNYLTLYLNHLSIKDISIMNEILFKYFYFQQIELSSKDPQKSESTNKRYRNNKEIREKQENLRNMTNKIIIGISKHLSLSKIILNLSISDLEFLPKYCEYLSKGIIDNKSLQGLKISNCQIQLKSYELLLKGLLNHIAITYLDLSNNNFGDRYGNMISRIIIRQAQRRDQIIWSYGLRNEKPLNNDYKKGLISINISGNKLGNDSAELIANALGTDQYLRAIYLNDNKIENSACKKFIYMMRKNLCLLTIDLRNNPGYDEYIHSRLVMKMSKNIRYLYQQYKKGEYSEEEFENYKEFIDATFFDVDIPQEIVEFYNKNLPETTEENGENQNLENLENDLNEEEEKEDKEDKEKEEDKKIKKNNYIIDDEEKKDIILKNKQLVDENLKLKQEIIELKAKNLQNKLGNNKKNDVNKETESDIDSYYHRVEELINELNEIMNKIEKKKLKLNDNNIIENKESNNNTKSNENIEIIKEEKSIQNKDIQLNLPKKIEEKKEKEEKIIMKEDKNNNKDKIIKKENTNENKIIIKKEEDEEEEKNNNESKPNNNKNEDLEPVSYQGVLGEPSEERDKESSENNSHYVDEEGNIHNYDDLSEEEKMVIIQQQLILQKLQEEAEARGEQFDPQEYIEFLERQALEEEEEEELKEGKSSSKLNKSF